MIYPKAFYHLSTTSNTQYQTEESDSFDLDRLIAGYQDFWLSPTLAKSLKKKKLIVADWYYFSFYPEKLTQYHQVLQSLLQDGFEIFLWQDGYLLELTLVYLYYLDLTEVQDALIYESLEAVYHVAAEHHFSRDEVHILDQDWMNVLLHPGKAFQNEDISTNTISTTVFVLTNHAKVPLSSFYKNLELSKKKIVYQDQVMQSAIPEHLLMTATKAYQQVHWKAIQEHCMQWLEKQCLVSTLGILTLDDLRCLERLIFTIDADNQDKMSDCFISMQRHLPTLERLSLIIKQVDYAPNPGTLSSIKSVDLGFAYIDMDIIQRWLLALTHSKSIELRGYHHAFCFTTSFTVVYPHLNTLSLYGNDNNLIWNTNLSSLIFNCPNLKTLSLNHLKELPSHLLNFDTKGPFLDSLRDLELATSSLNMMEMFAIAHHFPNLNSLCLHGGPEAPIQGPINFPKQLETIHCLFIGFCRLQADDFVKILRALPSLRTLSLRSCEIIGMDASLKTNELPNLQILIFDDHEQISIFLVYRLLIAAPNLLHLKFPTNLPLDTLEFTLSTQPIRLQSVDFSNCKETTPSESDFRYCAHLELILGLEKISNPRIEEIRKAVNHPGLKVSLSQTLKRRQSTTIHHEAGLSSVGAAAKVSFDANPSNTYQYTISRIFYPLNPTKTIPDPTQYRQSIYQKLYPNPERCTIKDAFICERLGHLALEKCDALNESYDFSIESEDEDNLFFGKQTLLLTGEWQALASLSPREVLTRYHVKPSVEIDLQYSRLHNLYYVRAIDVIEPIQVTLDFTLQVFESPPLRLPREIEARIKFLKGFTPKSIPEMPSMTGEDYRLALEAYETGACRHRAFLFCHWLESHYPSIETRMVTNPCHAFVEIRQNQHWVRCDLGGYPSTHCIHDENNPRLLPGAPVQIFSLTETRESKLSHTQREEILNALRRGKDALPRTARTTKEYVETLMSQGTADKLLIECKNQDEIEALYEVFLHFSKRPVVYVQFSDDLCGKDTEFFQFAQNNYEGILVINYGNLSPEEWVRFNFLLELKRPPNSLLIGLLPTDLPLLPGCDFYSRFSNKRERCPFDLEALHIETRGWPIPNITHPPSQALRINFFNMDDWQKILLGRWMPTTTGKWEYQESEFVKALQRGQSSFVFDNAPWTLPKFTRFLKDALNKGYFWHRNKRETLPPIELFQMNGYDWGKLRERIRLQTSPTPEMQVLNQRTLHHFFSHYDVHDPTLLPEDGYIKSATRRLAVHYTHNLTEHQWAKLLTECEQHHVTLDLYIAPGAECPEAMGIVSKTGLTPNISKVVYYSTDIDTTLALLKRDKACLVLDISECSGTDLLSHLNATPELTFSKRPAILQKEMDANRYVILKGHCSEHLAQTLMPLLLKKDIHSVCLVVDSLEHLRALSPRIHSVTLDEKRDCLQPRFSSQLSELEPYLEQEPLARLEARGRALLRGTSCETLWQGLTTSALSIRDPGLLDLKQSAENASLFHRKRKAEIDHLLFGPIPEPYVFITGLSGTGKTTFVRQAYKNQPNVIYLEGESQLEKFLRDETPDKLHILFIDEANLCHRDWSELEGLFCNTPPTVNIRGEKMEVSPNHRIIFAGNPSKLYQDERTIAPFFERHGNCIEFSILPSDVLYEDLLKPLLQRTLLEDDAEELCKYWLEIYRFLCLQSTSTLLITPRELAMFAVMTLAYCEHPEHVVHPDPDEVGRWFAYQLAYMLVPEHAKKEFKSKFGQTIDLPLPLPPRASSKCHDEFLFTESRRTMQVLLDTYISLHESRSKWAGRLCYEGLSGFILEGPPGVGKSESLLAGLYTRGYHEVSNIDETTPINAFFRIKVSDSLQKKEAALRLAFRYGVMVIIDEINSSPMMERLLNALLMGKTPEGDDPIRPGFMVLGTQNPIKMAGRRAMSNAQAHRLTTLLLQNYPPLELQQILINKGVNTTEAAEWIEIYLTELHHAILEKRPHIPCDRDIIQLAETKMNRSSLKHIAITFLGGPQKKLKHRSDSLTEVHDFETAEDMPCRLM